MRLTGCCALLDTIPPIIPNVQVVDEQNSKRLRIS